MKAKYVIISLAWIFQLSSCSEDITSPILELQEAAVLHHLSPKEIVINKTNVNENFPTIRWDKAEYGSGAVVNYSVSLTNETTGKSINIGETGEISLQLTNSEVNKLLAKLGALPGQKCSYTLSLNSRAFDVYTNKAKNTISFDAVGYDPNVDNITWRYAYVAVGYPEWDFTTAYVIGDPEDDGTFRGYVYVEKPSTLAIIDGEDMSQILARDIVINDDNKGFFEITVDKSGSVTLSPSCNVWGLIGDATAGGWNDDTLMEYDPETRLWTVIAPMTANEFKFRANKDWSINFGGDDMTPNGLVYNGSNIKVPAQSPYIVMLDLTHGGKYTYSIEETTIELSSSFMTLPGNYQGWDPETEECYRVVSHSRDFKFIGSYYFDSKTEFKFYDKGSWIGIVGDMTWNDDKTVGSFVIGDGDNIVVPEAAYYKIYADTKKMTASLTKACWEVIGDATLGGWEFGQPMTFDPATGLWSIDLTLGDGEIKFRYDASWTINLGGTLSSLEQDGSNIKVSAGNYHITLDVSNNIATIVAVL